MLIYEKENKLNINFDNEVSEQPDLQISKEDDKTSVKIDGQESGGGSGGETLRASFTQNGVVTICDKTIAEIYSAYSEGKYVYAGLAGFPYYLTGVSETTCTFNNFSRTTIEGNNNGTSDEWEVVGKG